ncbi:hypothetical protein ACFQJD_04505 [Haloplanus sp. GCM10025708]|uniref:DUF7322 domain-containing protein n=1 Tax=Haloferacaceae TaxID=1644056 RepID=UPI00361D0DF4
MADDSRAERPWPDEPTEPDPERRWGDPERDLVRVPRTPEPTTDEADADAELREAFWFSVVLANVAVAGLALGLMLVYFRGMWIAGGVAVAVGAFALFRVAQHVRAFRERRADGQTADEEQQNA